MDRKTWQETIAAGCDRARPVRGGAMCKDQCSSVISYCDFNQCPKLKEPDRTKP